MVLDLNLDLFWHEVYSHSSRKTLVWKECTMPQIEFKRKSNLPNFSLENNICFAYSKELVSCLFCNQQPKLILVSRKISQLAFWIHVLGMEANEVTVFYWIFCRYTSLYWDIRPLLFRMWVICSDLLHVLYSFSWCCERELSFIFLFCFYGSFPKTLHKWDFSYLISSEMKICFKFK